VDRAEALLGALGLACSLFVALRLAETWRVRPGMRSHDVSVLGQSLSYPSANLAALVVAALASLGLVATAMMVAGGARELTAWRRARRWLVAQKLHEDGDVLVIADEHPRAFCAGLLRPRVYVSTGAMALLDEVALGAVLAHERHHARRRDPLRFAGGRVIARALFFVPGLRELVRRQRALAELSADESAMNAAPEYRSALARAMLSFAERSRPEDPTGIDPERVDHLLGEPPRARVQLLLCVLTASVLGLFVGIGMLAGRGATGSATLAPPLLSHRPCIVVVAMIPTIFGLVALRRRRRRSAWVSSD
jgi:hypothetical protein